MARFDLTDFEWSVIEPLLPNQARGVPRVDDRRVLNGIFLAATHRRALGRRSGTLRPAHDLRQPLQSRRRNAALSEAGTSLMAVSSQCVNGMRIR